MPKVIYGPIKVLQLIHNPGITGPGRIVQGLAKYIDRQGFALDVLCPEKGILPEDLRKNGTRIIPLVSWNILDIGNFLRLKKTIQKEGYHLFHIHSGQLNAFAKIMAKSLGIPGVILTEHLAVPDHGWIKNKLKLSLHLLLHRFSDFLVDKVIAVSETARDAFILRQNINPRKVETVYNGVDLEEAQVEEIDRNKIKAEWGIPADSPVLAVVGRLNPEKGQKIFIMACREIAKDYPQARFMLIGNGPEREKLEKLIEESGLKEKFVLTGFIKDIAPVFKIIDIVVQPSFEAGESFGLTVAEAMAKAKAVIVSDIGCFKEIISDGKDGLLFPAGDYLALAQDIRLLLGNPGLRNALGLEAQNTIKKKFDIRITVRQTEEVYKKLLRQKGFIIYPDHIRAVEEKFINALNREGALPPERLEDCRRSLKKLLCFIQGRKRSNEEICGYLAGEYTFLVEKFLQFIEERKIFLGAAFAYNCRRFKQRLKATPVSPKDYDERICLQSDQFQIDNYYQPKDRAMQRRIEEVISRLEPREGERILDIGCGVGTFAYHAALRKATSVGVDYSAQSIEAARCLVERFSLDQRVTFQQCDIAQGLPFADASFDKIVAADFIEHIDEAQKGILLAEIKRILKDSGRAVIFTPNGVREFLGMVKEKAMLIFGRQPAETRLHFGLTNRFHFEKMLKNNDFNFQRVFLDVERPYLARIPLFKEILSLNLLWVIEKKK